MLPADLLNRVIFFYATAQLESLSEAILLDAGKGFCYSHWIFELFFFFKEGIIDLSASFTLHCKDSMWKNNSFHEGTTRHDCPASCPLSTFNIGMLYTAALTYKSSQLVSNNINYICMPLSYYFIQLYSKTFLGVEDCSQISWYKVNLKSKI